MIKEAIGYGETIEQAKEDAVLKLNVSDDSDIEFDVLAFPKKKVLGLFGGNSAQVKAFIELPDPIKKDKPQKQKKVNAKPAKKQTDAPKKAAVVKEELNLVTEDQLASDSRAKSAIDYLKPILESLGCTNLSIKVDEKDNSAIIELEGEGLGVIIGHRGETLDSLQYLAGLAANNGGGYFKVSLNIGDYRQRREETLTNLAGRICKQVIETGKCRTLEPMNPYERRIIHTAVQNYDGVTSASFGEGADRRVVIGIEGTELKPLRQSGRRRAGHRDNRRPRNNNNIVSAPAREPKKDTDIPLYGKIN
ncbi:MAG: KH domain-containing protein [Ruminococcaceae bacterium]|nr:KH domain-containing protein [Oscillospiraceae bacterium]